MRCKFCFAGEDDYHGICAARGTKYEMPTDLRSLLAKVQDHYRRTLSEDRTTTRWILWIVLMRQEISITERPTENLGI